MIISFRNFRKTFFPRQSKVLLFFTFCLFFVFSASAVRSEGISKEWIKYFVKFGGQDAHNVLSIMKENGLILSRVDKNYAAFSMGETRLNDEEKNSRNVDEFEFVVQFHFCGSSDKLLSGKIDRIEYSKNVNSAQELLEEIIDFESFSEEIGARKNMESVGENYIIYSIGSGGGLSVSGYDAEFNLKIGHNIHNIFFWANLKNVCSE